MLYNYYLQVIIIIIIIIITITQVTYNQVHPLRINYLAS